MRLPAQLLRRRPDSHKGDFGHVFILAGSLRYSGAALLCAEASLRTGAGLVTLGVPKSISEAIIKIKPKEAMLEPLLSTEEGTIAVAALQRIKKILKKIDLIAIGPGLGQNKSTEELVRKLVKSANKPLIIDADGLNALVGNLNILRQAIITPHPGEMARLTGRSIAEVQKDRNAIAKRVASEYNLTVVLKGHSTVIADKQRIYVNKTGNPGMSTAGSGDVLTGMIAALWAQGLPEFEAAKYAVYLHGLAGDYAAKEKTQMGMIASDIIEKIPMAIKNCS